MPNFRIPGHIRSAAFSLVVALLAAPAQSPVFPAESNIRWDGTEPVAPGVLHLWKSDPGGPWVIHVLQADLREPTVHLETAKAGNSVQGRELTSVLARSHSSPGHRVAGAVNGDFFSKEGVPVGVQVLRGIVLKNPSYRSVFGVTEERRPFISRVSLAAQVVTPRGDTLHIHRVNGTRYTDELVLYNRYRGPTTATNRWGAEFSVRLVDSARVGVPFRGVVVAVDSLHGNSSIPAQGVVLSGHGLSRNLLLEHVHVADTLVFLLRLSPLRKPILEALGGLPRIVRDGRVSIETDVEGGENFKNVRHPRTAVGFSRDSTAVFLVTVDGRQPGWSVGMTLPELARLMLDLGAYQAMNLDGGGSTTMVVRDSVVNRPSDATGERPVANALLVVSTAAADTVSQLDLQPDSLSLPAAARFSFRLRAWDRYKVEVEADSLPVQWSCDPGLGTVDPRGNFRAATSPASGWLRVSYRTLRDSAFVRVFPVDSLWLEPPGAGLTTGETCPFRLAALFDETPRRWVYDPDAPVWTVAGNAVELTGPGVVHAVSGGVATLRARLLGRVAEATVGVDTGFAVILDRFDRLRGLWKFGGKNLRLWECQARVDTVQTTSPPRAAWLKVSFTRTGATPYASLSRQLPVGGRPGAFKLNVRSRTRVVPEVWLADRDGERFKLRLSAATVSNRWSECAGEASAILPGWQNPGAHPDYPLELSEIRFYFPGSGYNEHVVDTLHVDDLTVAYGTVAQVAGHGRHAPRTFRLFPPHPNPFQFATSARVFLPRPGSVQVRVYDVRGRLVWSQNRNYGSAGVHRVRWAGQTGSGFPAPSGVYLLKVRSGAQTRVAKVCLLR